VRGRAMRHVRHGKFVLWRTRARAPQEFVAEISCETSVVICVIRGLDIPSETGLPLFEILEEKTLDISCRA